MWRFAGNEDKESVDLINKEGAEKEEGGRKATEGLRRLLRLP